MKKFYTVFLIIFYSLSIYATSLEMNEPRLPSKNWKKLFDGKNIDDWSFVGLGDFAVESGTLKSRGKMGILWYTKKKFGNCVIRAVYKVSDPGTSSAVFVSIPKPPIDVWDAVNHAHQIKILDSADEYHRTGSVYSFSKARGGLTKPAGKWNTMDIFLRGEQVTVYINGRLASNYNPTQSFPRRQASSDPKRGPRAKTGYIGIQNHNDLINEVVGQVWFKEISVMPLPNK